MPREQNKSGTLIANDLKTIKDGIILVGEKTLDTMKVDFCFSISSALICS